MFSQTFVCPQHVSQVTCPGTSASRGFCIQGRSASRGGLPPGVRKAGRSASRGLHPGGLHQGRGGWEVCIQGSASGGSASRERGLGRSPMQTPLRYMGYNGIRSTSGPHWNAPSSRKIFAQNCMKMKEIEPRGEHTPLSPHGSTNGNILDCKREFSIFLCSWHQIFIYYPI